jgi:hypothetical protein
MGLALVKIVSARCGSDRDHTYIGIEAKTTRKCFSKCPWVNEHLCVSSGEFFLLGSSE